jgi:hypothetical protein
MYPKIDLPMPCLPQADADQARRRAPPDKDWGRPPSSILCLRAPRSGDYLVTTGPPLSLCRPGSFTLWSARNLWFAMTWLSGACTWLRGRKAFTSTSHNCRCQCAPGMKSLCAKPSERTGTALTADCLFRIGWNKPSQATGSAVRRKKCACFPDQLPRLS